MTKKRNKIYSLFSAALLCIFTLFSTVFACEVEEKEVQAHGDWVSIDYGSYVSVVAYKGSDTAVTIPSEIGGKPVREISTMQTDVIYLPNFSTPSAINPPRYDDLFDEGVFFVGVSRPESITVPDTVRLIGTGVFAGYDSIKEVILSEGLEVIAPYVFYGCTSLKSIELPSTVKQIGDSCFEESGLESVTLNTGLKSIGGRAFGNTNLKKLYIPETVSYIGVGAFHNCAELEEVTLSEGLTEIKSGTFINCVKIKEITIPEGVRRVLPTSFEYCTSLEGIYFPSTVTSVKSILSGNEALTDIYFNNGQDYIEAALGEAPLKNMYEYASEAELSQVKLHYEPIGVIEPPKEESGSEAVYKTVLKISALAAAAAFLLLLSAYGVLKLKNRPKKVAAKESSSLWGAAAKKCPRCGAEYGEAATYCYNCGRKLKK